MGLALARPIDVQTSSLVSSMNVCMLRERERERERERVYL